jgi:phage/plasmid primase-like uncharacterized protein
MNDGISQIEYAALASGISVREYAEVVETVAQAFDDPRLSAERALYRTDVCPVCGRAVQFRSHDVTAGQWICHLVGSWFGESA